MEKYESILYSTGTAHCANTLHYTQVYAIDFSRGFWYGTLPCPFTFEVTKLF